MGRMTAGDGVFRHLIKTMVNYMDLHTCAHKHNMNFIIIIINV